MISSDWLFETTLKISSSRKREDSIEPASKCVQLVKLHKNLDLLALFFPTWLPRQMQMVTAQQIAGMESRRGPVRYLALRH